MKLKDKVAIITGGARGIGKGIALQFAKEGASVVVSDLTLMAAESVTDKIEAMGRGALAVEADVAKAEDVERLFAETVAAFGRVDILVSNAGIRNDGPLHSLDAAEWEEVLGVQLGGCFRCAKAAQRHMVEQASGKIIILSSPVPAGLGSPGQTSYSAASAGLVGLTKSMAIELGAYNINVNCIAPDFIETQMTRESIRKDGLYLDDLEKIVQARVPLRRLGTAEDVANVAVFLASDDSSFVSGQVIEVKGGP